jgi:alkylhydroperoxidase family enzyme
VTAPRKIPPVFAVLHTHATEDELEGLRQHFDKKEMVELAYAVAQINAWNRLPMGLLVPVKRAALSANEEAADAR